MENFFPLNDVKHPMFDKILNKKIGLFVFIVFAFFIFFYFLFFSAPKNFPEGTMFNIKQGATLRNVSLNLKQEHIIRSRLFFEAFTIIYGGDRHVIFSDYFFEERIPVFEVARRISNGDHRLNSVKITIPEGFTAREISDVASAKLSYFNKDKFLISAQGLEGYLFPDTYFFFPNATEDEVLKSLNENFKKKISNLEKDIIENGKSQTDIIKMASIIEKEAKGDADRAIISGILWKRLSINMPLQADAAPETYKTRGLPKLPIGNPGLLAIKAAIFPQSSPYLYYLHDKNGDIHYAKSFAEHQRNIFRYLK